MNALIAASEIDDSIATIYFLKHSDHHTNHQFRTCYWKGSVSKVMKVWDGSIALSENAHIKIILEMQKRGKHQQIVTLLPMIDYMWCLKEYEDICLYD